MLDQIKTALVDLKNRSGSSLKHIVQQLISNSTVWEVADCIPTYRGPMNSSSINWEKCIVVSNMTKRITSWDLQIISDGQRISNIPRQFIRQSETTTNDGTTTNDWKSLEGLHAAAQNGKVEDVKRLLSNGIDINKQNEEGMTAMHWACDGNHSNVVELLLSNNAKHDIQDQEGMSALHYAIPHPNVATLLINAGANVHSQDNEGTSCLDMCDDEDQGPKRILRKDVERLVEKRQ